MDSTVPEITFNEDGECNFCVEFKQSLKDLHLIGKGHPDNEIKRIVSSIQLDGKHKKYDCIIGLSGGVDSAWVLYKAKLLGLRPLAVHMDNGWNSELAQNNIEKLIRYLKVDLITHVIDWTEYKGLMQSFFDADVVDVELLYDNAMLAVNYRMAKKYKVKWILAGTNASTEGMRMPVGWNWYKFDAINIKSIAKIGGIKIKSFPIIGGLEKMYLEKFKHIQWFSFLDIFEYKKEEALSILSKECGFRPYPYKHYESIFTRFYQGYILPNKFGIDKRKIHLSTLIISGQISRDDSINILNDNPYSSAQDLKLDTEYFLKKIGWNQSQLDDYILRSAKSHNLYKSEITYRRLYKKIKKILFF
jgi:N-acetyl sugar amidotransferase